MPGGARPMQHQGGRAVIAVLGTGNKAIARAANLTQGCSVSGSLLEKKSGALLIYYYLLYHRVCTWLKPVNWRHAAARSRL